MIFPLQLAAKRSSKIGLPIGGTKEAEDRRLESLLQWAIDSFEPLGIDGLKPKYVGKQISLFISPITNLQFMTLLTLPIKCSHI